MLYLYLSHSNRQVILPTAVSTGTEDESDPLVSFVDSQGQVVAVFLRADVAIFSAHNLGPQLPANAGERSENTSACC